MKKNLWLFGDSFTNCSYQGIDPKYSKDIIQWGDIVSKQMGLTLFNHGKGGYSNQHIIATILHNLHKIEKNDFVSIGLSTPFRTITVRNGVVAPFLSMDYVHSKSKEDKWVLDYTQNILYPNEDLINEFYWTQTRGIKKLLEKIDCNVYLWDYKLWDSFESIKKYSKGKDKDPHWSKKGNEDMAKYIIEKFNKSDKTFI